VTRQDPGDAALLLPEGARLVHIGPPKTGTTALQGAFHHHRPEVLAQGVRYCGRARHSGAAVLAATGRPAFLQDSGSPPISKWQALAREARTAREPRVIVSSEFFADAEAEQIPRIVEDLGGDRVHVVVTLRPLARILSSQWQQYVQSGLRMDFDPWLDAMFNKPPGAFMATFWRRHRHDELIARWMRVVGPDRLTVIVVDESDHDRLLRQFEGLLGLRVGTLVAHRDLANRSMTMPEIQAVRAFNVTFKGAHLGNALFHRVMHFGAATHMKLQPPSPDWPGIEVPQWALDRAQETAREMVASIGASGARIVGELDGLTAAAPSKLAGPTQPEVPIPPEVAANMAIGVLVASGLAMSLGDGRVAPPTSGRRAEPTATAHLSTRYLAAIIAFRGRDSIRRRVRSLMRRRDRVP
jgi:hypothetical protein